MQIPDYCREIETYLCQRNDGHLIRVVGPSFDLVSGWAARGVPLKVAFSGIDRYCERYYRKGPRRRPVRIDFCEADVLDVFDEWRRALGLPAASTEPQNPRTPEPQSPGTPAPENPSPQLPVPSKRQPLSSHLERIVLRLTSARATGKLDSTFDELIDSIARELDAARAEARGVRGEARQALLARLRDLDVQLLEAGRRALDEPARMTMVRAAEEDLSSFRATMADEVFARAREAAVDQRVREHFGLPTIALL